MNMATVLLIEPFCAGSHKQLIDLLQSSIPGCETFSLPGKKWHWKARTSALWLSQEIPKNHHYRILFASSVLNLAELIALRPDLGSLHKVLYFHENQLIYPVRNQKERDFQYGYNQIVSSMVADTVLFNSKYNMDSFLGNVNSFLKAVPDHRPKGIPEILRPKCSVLNFPILFPAVQESGSRSSLSDMHRKLYTEVKVIGNDTASQCAARDNTPSSQCKYSDSYNSSVENIISDQFCGSITAKSKNSALSPVPIKSEDYVSMTASKDNIRTKQSVCSDSSSDEHNLMQTEEPVHSSKGNNHVEILEPVQSELTCIRNSREPVHSSQKDIRDTVCRTVSMKQTLDSWESSQPVKRGRICSKEGPIHIVWPHRWEHDKDPDLFFRVILKLQENGLDFNLSVLGGTFQDIPAVFEESQSMLGDKIINWGYQPSKDVYFDILRSADCVVSTAKHEFFGVAMLEAVHLGCYPVCPNQLVYPEIFPKECLYNTEPQLYKVLREMCRKPYIVRNKKVMVDTNQYSWETLNMDFFKHLKLHEYS